MAARTRRGSAAGLLALCLAAAPSAAETLQEAMAAALQHYPPVLAEEARRRAAQAGINVARAGYYPRVTASGDIGAASGPRGLAAGTGGSSLGDIGSPFGKDWSTRWGYAVTAEQPLFDGYRTHSSVAEARAGADAAGAQVRLTEQLVLLEAVTVYADLIKDRKVEALRARDAATLGELVKSTAERARRGDASETDVAQVRSRHAQALADLITARASAEARTAEYARVIGRPPGKLSRPSPPEALLPRSLEASLASAHASHPVIAVVTSREEASRHSIDRHRADGLPQVKLRGGIEGDHAFSGSGGSRDGASAAVRVSVPLLDGGEVAARVEQARQISRSLAEEARGVRERLQASVQAAWTGLAAARERLAVEHDAATESRRALDNIREEIKLGQRSLLDGLDLQREVVIVEVRVATSERDLLVAGYALLSASGLLSAPARAPPASPRAAPGGWGAVVVKSQDGR